MYLALIARILIIFEKASRYIRFACLYLTESVFISFFAHFIHDLLLYSPVLSTFLNTLAFLCFLFHFYLAIKQWAALRRFFLAITKSAHFPLFISDADVDAAY